MKKQEAIEEMRSGKKVTHQYFSDEEFITMNGNKIVDENGYRLNPIEFWSYRTSKSFDTDWSIFKSKPI